VAILLDTSGSMGEEGARVLAQVEAICRLVGEVHLIAHDTEAHVGGQVRSAREARTRTVGGGGTDFADVYQALEGLRLKPDVAVHFTDCNGSGWPKQPPKGVRVIVAATGDHPSPAWAKRVEVKDE
jgi:predicted metal-dependent peptidase